MIEGQVLEEAAQVLLTHGWNKFGMEKDGRFCALGAIYHAMVHIESSMPEDPWDFKESVFWDLAETISEQYPDWYAAELEDNDFMPDERLKSTVTIAQFNDAPRRTLDEVVAMFEKAARR